MTWLILFIIFLICSLLYKLIEHKQCYATEPSFSSCIGWSILSTIAIGFISMCGFSIIYMNNSQLPDPKYFVIAVEETHPLMDMNSSTFLYFDIETNSYRFVYNDEDNLPVAGTIVPRQIAEVSIGGDVPRVYIERWRPRSWLIKNLIFHGCDITMYRFELPVETLAKLHGFT